MSANTIPATLHKAKQRAARIAMADLLGTSGDGYPFAAVKFRKSLPIDWQDEVEDVIVYVYHNETVPLELRRNVS